MPTGHRGDRLHGARVGDRVADRRDCPARRVQSRGRHQQDLHPLSRRPPGPQAPMPRTPPTSAPLTPAIAWYFGRSQIMVNGNDPDAIHRTWDVLVRLLQRTLVRNRAHERWYARPLRAAADTPENIVHAPCPDVVSTRPGRSSWPRRTAPSISSTRAVWYGAASECPPRSSVSLSSIRSASLTPLPRSCNLAGHCSLRVCHRPGGRPP